jgi:hypothetical protein
MKRENLPKKARDTAQLNGDQRVPEGVTNKKKMTKKGVTKT